MSIVFSKPHDSLLNLHGSLGGLGDKGSGRPKGQQGSSSGEDTHGSLFVCFGLCRVVGVEECG